MAARYDLQPNEVVVLKEDNVMNGGTWAGYTDQLILTNLNLVLVRKGVFGGFKGLRTFPLNQIKLYNDRAQASLGKTQNGLDVLEVYLLNGHEQFGFNSGGKKKIREWAGKINEVVTGRTEPDQTNGKAIPGSDLVAGVLKDTMNVFKSKLGAGGNAPPAAKIAKKCGSCGAPVSGWQGQSVACEYCHSVQQL